MKLELEHVTRRVGAEHHLHPISMTVEPGAVTVLLGVTLAGKTSLMRLMAGLDTPSSGRVLVDGRDVTGMPVRQRDVSMVYQQFINYPSLTVAANIASPLRLRRAANIEQTVREIATRLHIEHLLHRLPAELSGGQQQRVALARALAKNAPLMLLDEPLANLDYKLREELREDLGALFERGEGSVVYATTEPAEALMLGGYTAVLDQGRLLQSGPTLEVYRRPNCVAVARAFSDPPINLVRGMAEGLTVAMPGALSIRLAAPLGLLPQPVQVGIRAADIRLPEQARSGDLRCQAEVSIAEISGSDSFVHLRSPLGELVLQRTGVHRFEPGERLSVCIHPADVYLFDEQERLVKLPDHLGGLQTGVPTEPRSEIA